MQTAPAPCPYLSQSDERRISNARCGTGARRTVLDIKARAHSAYIKCHGLATMVDVAAACPSNHTTQQTEDKRLKKYFRNILDRCREVCARVSERFRTNAVAKRVRKHTSSMGNGTSPRERRRVGKEVVGGSLPTHTNNGPFFCECGCSCML